MARKRKADHNAVVAAALELFWDQGYEGANTREIEEKTGLTRFTLQTVYGGKQRFFLDTLDAYLDRAEFQHFPNPETFGLGQLADWFEKLVDSEHIPGIDQTGCLAFNSIGSFDRENAEINVRIDRYFQALEQRFCAIINNAIESGEARKNLDAEDTSRLLLNNLLGLHVLIKARTNDSLPQQHAKSIATMIHSWRNPIVSNT